MGQTRNDSPEQRAAKERRMKRSQCPRCGRKGATVSYNDGLGIATGCRYGCGFETYRAITDPEGGDK